MAAVFRRVVFALIFFSALWQLSADAAGIPEITNLKEIAQHLKLSRFKGKKFAYKIKVAVLDNGFSGYEAEVGKTLPKDTYYHAGKASAADQIENSSFHGLFMAQLIAELIRISGAEADYELHLYNAFGYTKFSDAVDNVMQNNFDVVLYSQVWEYGGNGDSRGFINALVDKIVAAEVIWINAAGNFGKATRLAPVDGRMDSGDEWVTFIEGKKNVDSVTITCKAEKDKTCPLRLVLSWNDFKDDPLTGTDKDLDLILYDSEGIIAASSAKRQVLNRDPLDNSSSGIPRELIEKEIKAGSYKVKVKIASPNFDPEDDQLRITASGRGISLSGPSEDETLLPPADNPGAIVIGASDDPQTSRSKKFSRPEVYLKSSVKLKDGSNPFSTSTAAAMAAAVTVLHLGVDNQKTRESVLSKLKTISIKPGTSSAPSRLKAKAKTAKKPQRRTAPRRPAQHPRRPPPRQYPPMPQPTILIPPPPPPVWIAPPLPPPPPPPPICCY